MLIGVTGFKGSGKDTFSNILVKNFNFTTDQFATPIKDVCAIVFGWERSLLEGDTKESREWREKVDTWWSNKLAIPGFSPRLAMQLVGTEGFRKVIHPDIWIISLQNRINRSHSNNVIVTDCRMPNELAMVKAMGGITIQVQRGENPSWYNIAADYNNAVSNDPAVPLPEVLENVHATERAWIGTNIDIIVDNNGSIEDLEKRAREIYQDIYSRAA